MSERVDLGAELAGYTDDADHVPPSRPTPSAMPSPPPSWARDTGRLDNVVTAMQQFQYGSPPGPLPSFVITDPPHPNQMPIPPDAGAPPPVLWTDGVYRPANADVGGSRCNQCRRYIPLPAGLFIAAECLYCDECAWMRGG